MELKCGFVKILFKIGILFYFNLYFCIWFIIGILCGGYYVIVVVDVLSDRWVRWISVRFFGGLSIGEYYERMK